MKIGILQAGTLPEELVGAFVDYDDMFRALFKGQEFEFTTYRVLDGVFPETPNDQEGWLITGSKFGVYEDHAFIPPLEAFIRKAGDVGTPMVGICFGHQVIAQALGGVVEKSDEGWKIGAQTYDGMDGPLTLNAWHQDQVTVPPDGATVILNNSSCRFAALQYGARYQTWQAHPEYDSAFISALQDVRRSVLPQSVADQAIDPSNHWPSRTSVLSRMSRFLLENRPAARTL